MSISLRREELVAIVERLCAGEGTEEEMERDLDRLHAALPLVPWTDFIYWPTGFPHDPTAQSPTPEQIVDRALAFQPSVIIIPPRRETP